MPHLLFVFRLSTGLSMAQMGRSPPPFGLKEPQMCLHLPLSVGGDKGQDWTHT